MQQQTSGASLRPFLLLWSTQSLSQLGSAMTSFALIIWAYGQTGSALSTALLTVCSYAPYVCLSVFAGALCDRWDKKTVMLASDSFAALCTAAVLVLAALALAADILLTTAMSRRTGVSWKAIGGAIVGGIAGGVWLSGLALVGALFGVLIGALLGLFLVETLDKRDWRAAWRGVRSYLAGSLLATAAEFGIALLMVGLFIARVNL